MVNTAVALIFISYCHVTAYRSVPSQTDSSPFITSTGERVSADGCAVSQDLLRVNGGPFEYGQWIYIEGVGWRRINDCTNKRLRKHIDLWVKTRHEEHQVWRRFKNQTVGVYRLGNVFRRAQFQCH